jgi:hypothetical protein
VEQLEWHGTCVRNAEGLCLLQQSLYEIERLRAENERLRAAGDALADLIAKCGCVDDWERCSWCIAKDKWQEARRG